MTATEAQKGRRGAKRADRTGAALLLSSWFPTWEAFGGPIGRTPLPMHVPLCLAPNEGRETGRIETDSRRLGGFVTGGGGGRTRTHQPQRPQRRAGDSPVCGSWVLHRHNLSGWTGPRARLKFPERAKPDFPLPGDHLCEESG